MERLTFDGNFCDIAMCGEIPGNSSCEDGCCSEKKVWERLKYYEDAEAEGRLFIAPVAVGQEVWVVGRSRFPYPGTDGLYILSAEVTMVSKEGFSVCGSETESWISNSEIGHNWFLSKEDAVQELELIRRAATHVANIRPI